MGGQWLGESASDMDDYGFENQEGERVIDFNSARRNDVHPALARVDAYWNQQRKGRLVPSRSDIDPMGLEGVLGNVFIAERISTGLARFRIAGSHLNDIVGLDVRGMPVSAIFNSVDREKLAQSLKAVFDHPATVHVKLESAKSFGRGHLAGEMMFLPLRSDLGEISRALGVVAMSGDVGRTPRRFSILGEVRRGLTGYGGPEAAQHRDFEVSDNVPTKPPRQTLSQHLRLVADNTSQD